MCVCVCVRACLCVRVCVCVQDEMGKLCSKFLKKENYIDISL